MEKNYDIWVPAYTGEKPPLWLVGMHWAVAPEAPGERENDPAWISGTEYTVPLLALPPQAAQPVGGGMTHGERESLNAALHSANVLATQNRIMRLLDHVLHDKTKLENQLPLLFRVEKAIQGNDRKERSDDT